MSMNMKRSTMSIYTHMMITISMHMISSGMEVSRIHTRTSTNP